MGQRDYYTEFHEALAKAFAAKDPKVREAWLDLANFCRSMLPDVVRAEPEPELPGEVMADLKLGGGRPGIDRDLLKKRPRAQC